ncbi:hypothetical protein [Azospirillum largimobile]
MLGRPGRRIGDTVKAHAPAHWRHDRSRSLLALPPIHPGLRPACRPIRPSFLSLIGLCRKRMVGIKREAELTSIFQRFNAAARSRGFHSTTTAGRCRPWVRRHCFSTPPPLPPSVAGTAEDPEE